MIRMLSARSQNSQGIALGLFAMTCYSINDALLKSVLATVSVAWAMALSHLVTVVLVFAYARLNRISLRPGQWKNLVIFILFFLLEQLSFIYALKLIPFAELFVIILAAPLVVLISSALFLDEKLSVRENLAVLSGFLATMLVLIPAVFQDAYHVASGSSLAGYGFAIANIFIHAGKILFLRKFCKTENNFSFSFFGSLFFVFLFGFQAVNVSHAIDAGSGFLILTAGIIATVATFCYLRAFQLAKAPYISATQYIQIVWAAGIGFAFFSERPTLYAAAGCCLILLSGLFLYSKSFVNSRKDLRPSRSEE